MKWLMALWHWLRPRLVRLLTEECLERYLYRIGFYKIKSRILVDRCVFPGGIDLWVRAPDKGIVSGVLAARCYERAQIHPGDTVLDVGGHVGSYAVLASKRVGGKGRVHTFEPEPENLRLLRKNVALNACTNVAVHPFALSDENGPIRFFVREPPERHSIMGGSGVVIQVPGRCLDDVVAEAGLSHVDVLKIDAEGAELKILFAGTRTLRFTRQVIMELHKEMVSLDSMTDFMTSHGFACEILDNNPEVAILYARRK